MSLFAILICVIVAAGIGVGIYFLVKKKSKPPVVSSDKPTSLQIIEGTITNQQS